MWIEEVFVVSYNKFFFFFSIHFKLVDPDWVSIILIEFTMIRTTRPLLTDLHIVKFILFLKIDFLLIYL